MNGYLGDVWVSDGNAVKIYTPDQYATTVNYWTMRDQPYLYAVTDAASSSVQPLSPGQIATLWTWGATHNDPQTPSELPLPVEACEGQHGKTKVVFTDSAGRSLEAPFFYCSQLQLNAQVPEELPLGPASVKVVLNQTESNAFPVEIVASQPGIFLVAPDTGAIIDEKGRLVTEENPAHPSGYITVYATGLGAVAPAVGTGRPAPAHGAALSRTVLPTTAELGGRSCHVVFSGLAPGFVGLYQVNLQIPQDVPSGVHSFLIKVNGISANEVKLAVLK